MEQDLTDLITVPEAARRAGVAKNTMFLAAKQGTIKAVKMGRYWFVSASDIERWKKESYRPDKAKRYPAKSQDDGEDAT